MKGAIETIDVKSALMADRTVDASHINVDTFHETKTVVLKGSVKTATQRDEAARIAAAEAPGYRIDNQVAFSASQILPANPVRSSASARQNCRADTRPTR